jgi:DNA-directed RNA polymerase specialized sigma24 family protein
MEADEEDAAAMAFYAMLDGFTNGRFQGVTKRDDFWKLLVAITNRNISKIRRRNQQLKRGGGHTRSQTPAEELQDEADAQAIVDLSDTIRAVVSSLPSERYQTVFFLRAAGHSHEEIVEKTGQSKRTVARQLDMIRQIWSKQE